MAGNIHANSKFSPSFIKAKTPEELEKLMLMNNLVNSKVFDYTSISYSAGFWYAWYYKDQTDKIKVMRKDQELLK